MSRAKPEGKTAPTQSDLLRLEYVPLEVAVAWEENPKKHDAGAIFRSIEQHGFRDPPAFDARLNGGRGGIVEGNGRSHVLKEMRLAREKAPRGIVETPEGEWLMPVLFGVDAESERAAQSYGVAHNNLVLAGGDFTAFDMARLWDEAAYVSLLADLAAHDALPATVDGEDVDDLVARLARSGSPLERKGEDGGGGGPRTRGSEGADEEKGEGQGKEKRVQTLGVFVVCQGEQHQRELLDELKSEGYEVKPLKAHL